MPELTLLRIARTLRDWPRAGFRERLKADLIRTAEGMAAMTAVTESVSALRQSATAYLRVRNAPAAIEFYKQAFGAVELMRFTAQDRIAHAELAIGNTALMLAEEAPEYGFPGPETLGGTTSRIHLYVNDVDAAVARAVAAGARVTMPVADQFYGDRVGQVADPFGHGWTLATHKEDVSVGEMNRRFEAMMTEKPAAGAPPFIREGFRTVTAYLRVADVPALIDFVTTAFDAEEMTRLKGGSGIHAEIRMGDSMLMMGGGAPGSPLQGRPLPTAFHLYVPDTDLVYERALKAGAISTGEPKDQWYGERSAGVRDTAGNDWYIATAKGEHYIPKGLQTLNVFLHPFRAEAIIAFMKRAFDVADVQKYATPDGVVHHAMVRIGDSTIEMGDAHGAYQPMPTMFYVYVPNVDAAYRRILQAGAKSVREPVDQPYGDRVAGAEDPFGNQWFVATRIRA